MRVVLFAFGVSFAAAACGTSDVKRVDYGQPPDAALFNTGNGGNGDGYGSGQNDAGPPSCTDDLKRCAEDFSYPFAGETSVELRGDYRDGAWVTGDPMLHTGSAWKVTVPVPYNKPVQYKFFVNGSTWVVDPNNPNKYTDPQGNTNSVATAITCTNFTCAEPPLPPPGVYDWRDAVIYFAFVDRFLDGNPANNCSVAGTDAPGNYKGGDWAGLTQKIQAGYFTDLGVNTLWVTVPLQNADTFAGHGVGGDTHMYSAYHGYWPLDPTLRERCFGSVVVL
jgi:hypothetical protein